MFIVLAAAIIVPHNGPSQICLYAGFQLIHYAVEGGNRDIVKFLIDQDFGLPELTQDGRAFTPLHLASRAGHADLVSLLLNVGYSADRADKNGRTPLHCAAEGGHIGWLEANQANMMAPPGHMRPRTDHRHITRELLGQGVDPTALDDAMCTALHYACSELLPFQEPVIVNAVLQQDHMRSGRQALFV